MQRLASLRGLASSCSTLQPNLLAWQQSVSVKPGRASRRSFCAPTGAKASDESYKLNINKAVDKKYETKSFKELSKMPPGVLQGLAEGKADEALKSLKIYTIEDLGTWKYYKAARTISTLAACEESGARVEDNVMNLNLALDKQFERCSLQEMLVLPPSALQGLADWTDGVLEGLRVKTIGDLASWKYAAWAEAIAQAAELESEDFSHK